MIRVFQISIDSEDRGLRSENGISDFGFLPLVFCLLTSVFCLLAGCTQPEKEPIWETVKIGDLAPSNGDKPPQTELLKTINFDLHIFELPADNIDKMDDIWKMLYIRPLRFNDYRAFGKNSFLARFGQVQRWNKIQELLLAADAQLITKVALFLPDGQTQTITVIGLDSPRTVFFTSISGSREGANIGPGILALRVKAKNVPGFKGICDLTAHPVFSVPITSAVPQLSDRVKFREFPFIAAAFGLNISPGDFVMLGPKEYISDLTDLGGLFFTNPQGSLFLSETELKPLELKPTIRIFILFCTRINY